MKENPYHLPHQSSKRRVYCGLFLTLLILILFTFLYKKLDSQKSTVSYIGNHREKEDHTQKLLKKLNSLSAKKRQYAVEKLDTLGSQAIPVLLWATKDSDPDVRWHALLTLSRVDPGFSKSFHVLPTLAMDSNWATRETVILSISQLKQKHFLSVLYAMLQSLNKQHLKNQRKILQVIQRIGPRAATILVDLERLLDSASIELHQVLAITIASLGKKALPVLIQQFKRATDTRKASIIQSFGYMEQFAENLLPFLLESLQSSPTYKEFVTKNPCWESFQKQKMKMAFPASIQATYLINKKKCIIRYTSPVYIAALQSLKKFGSRAVPALPFLSKLLHDPNFMERYQVLHVLGSMGQKAKIILPDLQQILNSREFLGQQTRGYFRHVVKKIIHQIQETDPH